MTGGGGYTGLTTLAVTGVPAGATAAFASPTLTAGQTTLLTLTTTGTTPSGAYALTVTASGLSLPKIPSAVQFFALAVIP